MVFTAIYILTTVKHPERKLKANALASATGFYLLCTYFIFGLEYIVLLIGGILLLMDGVLGLNENDQRAASLDLDISCINYFVHFRTFNYSFGY